MFMKENPDRIKKFDWGKNTTMFGVDNSSLAHNDNKKKDILVLGEGPTQGLDDTTITTETEYSFTFTRLNKVCIIMKATVLHLLMP